MAPVATPVGPFTRMPRSTTGQFASRFSAAPFVAVVDVGACGPAILQGRKSPVASVRYLAGRWSGQSPRGFELNRMPHLHTRVRAVLHAQAVPTCLNRRAVWMTQHSP